MANTANCYEHNNGCNILPENKLSLTAKTCIKNLAQKEGFKSYLVDVKDISTNGGNYLAALQTVDVKNEEGDEEINLFLKNSININEDFFFSMAEVYQRESFTYSGVLKKYAQLQEEYKIPEDERYNIVKSYSGMNSEVIILENLSKIGFETCERRDVFSLKFAELAIAQLAKFHGLSFALQNKEPIYFEENIKNKKCVQNFELDWQSYTRRAFEIAIEGLEGEAKVKLAKFYPEFVEKYEKYCTLSDEDAVCLCHGDFRQNNVLVKKINGVESKMFVVDYQFVNFASPVLDIIYFIFGASDQEFRTLHMEHLKDLYYDSLEKFLSYFDVKAEDVYSRRRFEKEFKEKLDYGLMTFVIILPFLFTTDDKVPDFKGEVGSLEFCLDDGYKKRIRETVDFFIQEGYL